MRLLLWTIFYIIQTQEAFLHSIKSCSTNPCLNKGTCLFSLWRRSKYVCKCKNGSWGPHCENTDDCFSNPCQNNGSCLPVMKAGYFCECITGFWGKHCEKSGDPCSPNPCKNKARCSHLTTGGHYCECLDGFTGKYCEIAGEDSCETSPCRNGGRCIDQEHQMRCFCTKKFGGIHCQMPTSCNPNHCQNAGVCKEYVMAGSSCECLPGFTGIHCEHIDGS